MSEFDLSEMVKTMFSHALEDTVKAYTKEENKKEEKEGISLWK